MFGTKQYPENAGYPTPTTTPTETTCLIIPVPASAEWWAIYVGLLYTLTLEDSWQQFDGGLSREDAANAALDTFWAALENSLNNFCSDPLPAPFWDDPEADDASTGESNPEYPFYENAANFALAGFVLYAAGPGAALQYWVTAEQFRLAFRKHDLGGIVKIFMDDDLIGQVDTYAAIPEQAYFDVINTGTTLRLEVSDEVNPEVTGAPVVQILRKQLTPDDVIPEGIIYDEINDEILGWNGVDYEPAPDSDPRHGIRFLAPPRTGDDPRCDAAASIVRRIEEIIDGFLNAASIIQAVNAIGGIIGLFMFGFAVLARLIVAVVLALFEIGVALIELNFNPATYDQLTCIVWQHAAVNGQISVAAKDAIYADIEEQMTSVQFAVLSLIINMLGEVGLSNAGARGTEIGDCSDCCDPAERWIDVYFDGMDMNAIGISLDGSPTTVTAGTMMQDGGVFPAGYPYYSVLCAMNLTEANFTRIHEIEFETEGSRNDATLVFQWQLQHGGVVRWNNISSLAAANVWEARDSGELGAYTVASGSTVLLWAGGSSSSWDAFVANIKIRNIRLRVSGC